MKRALLVLILGTVAQAFLPVQKRTASAQNPPQPAAGAPTGELQRKVEVYLRKLYAWGPSFQVKVGAPAEAEIPGFYRLTIEVSLGGETDTATMHISKDGRHLIRGEVFNTNVDPFEANRRSIHTEGQPSRGPANARITVVHFSDFQCPHCKQLDTALRQLVQQYPQVRFVSKHFPLSQVHPWAMTAHIAAECTYQLNPGAYWKVHDAIFDQQEQITVENAWQRMLDIATAAGVDAAPMRTCMASPDPKAPIEKDLAEGRAVRIATTPTVFINGRRIVGGEPGAIRQYIEYELSTSPPATPQAPTPKP